jgi:chitinase
MRIRRKAERMNEDQRVRSHEEVVESLRRPVPGRPRLSLLRIFLALALCAGVGGALVAFGGRIVEAADSPRSERAGAGPWYAPYVDVTLTPEYHFEDLSANPSNDVVLSFIVASRDGACAPTWGTYFDLDGAATALDLDRRITRLRQRGGDLIVSFGGEANDELARHCDDDGLRAAYSAVIDRYKVTTLDFDIEGTDLADTAANERRGRVVKALQKEAAAANRDLAVWLTLPVAPTGLTGEAVGVIDSMLAAKVDLAGVNLMAMNFGSSRQSSDMVDATADALDATWRQLDAAYRRAGVHLTAESVWRKIGVTPMIGQNDDPLDRITLGDARRVLELALDRGIGRMSMWSLNRDTACGAQLDLGMVSDLCSGVKQEALAFTYVFDTLPGRPAAAAKGKTVTVAGDPRDDPATSPHPIWTENKVYEQGDKVTWHRNVYEAKWWSRHDVPDEPVVNEWDTPWRFLGPVLPGDRPAPPPTLPNGTYPTWGKQTVYVKGERVQLDGLGYEAKWWTRGERPDADVAQPWDSPWESLERSHTR